MKLPESNNSAPSSSKRSLIKALLLSVATSVAGCSKEVTPSQSTEPTAAASASAVQAPEKPAPAPAPAPEKKADRMPTCPERKPHDPPIIGLSGHLKAPDKLHDKTKQWIAEAGGEAIRLNPGNYEGKKCDVDGIILTGGNDIPGGKFGEKSHPSVKPLEEGRFEFDMQLIDLAEKVRLPILGICLGMQEMWVRDGGKLIQDIPSWQQKGDIAPLNHRKPHEVYFYQGSFLGQLYKGRLKSVFSNHHQAIAERSDEAGSFESAAFSSGYIDEEPYNEMGTVGDDIDEAIESKKMAERFQVGIQWHPRGKNAVKLYQALVEEAKKRN